MLFGGTLDDAGGADDGLGVLHNLAGHDAMFQVVSYLFLTMTVGLVYGALHAAGNRVTVEDGLAVNIAGGAADGLDKGAVAAQEALLVGIEDGHKRHLGQVESLTQQVDTHQHIEHTHAQVTHDFHALEGVHIAMDVFTADAEIEEVGGHLLGHAFGERGDQNTLVFVYGLLYFVQ